MVLSEPTRRNIIDYILLQYKLNHMSPTGGFPKTYSKIGHMRLFTRGLQFWEPHKDERASCCDNKKATRSNPQALLKHCLTRTHLDKLSKEKIFTLEKKLDRLLVSIEAFDPLKAPLLINHSHTPNREVALGTLKGSYK